MIESNKTKTFASDTSKRTFSDWVKAVIILFIGLTIAHLGVTLFLLSNLGTDTFTVFMQGLARTFGLSIGTFHVIILSFLTLLIFLFTKDYVKPGTILCAFVGGPIIDFFMWLLEGIINARSPLILRFFSMLLGVVVLVFGMSVVIKSDAGTGPNDLIAIILTDKFKHFEFRWVRIACDICFVTLGFLFGGTVGIGTIAAALLTGPIVQFWLPRSEKLIKRFL